MSQISIELNQQEFVGGDKLEGVVVVQLAQDTPIRGIRIRLQGYEKSHWREGSGKHRHTHSERLDFFDEEITLQGRPRLGLGAPVLRKDHCAAARERSRSPVSPGASPLPRQPCS